jgi:hypothetical protein
MHWIGSTRGVAVLLLLAGSAVRAQSTLPATGPTALPAPNPQVSAGPTVPAADSPKRAVVTYSDGQLEVTADNSSLNQILREIGRVTGMKITGGVADERVFGKYGPGAPAEILVKLLDGTGSNVLLQETASKVPAELILTARQGGPTPPNPNARDFDEGPPANEERVQQSVPPVPNQSDPTQPNPAAAAAWGPGPNPMSRSLSTPDASNPNSPNRVQTPQQIFDQLQRLQQSQPQPPANHP